MIVSEKALKRGKTDEEIIKQYEFKPQRRTEKLHSAGHSNHGHGHHGHGHHGHGHHVHKHNYDSTIRSYSTLVIFGALISRALSLCTKCRF